MGGTAGGNGVREVSRHRLYTTLKAIESSLDCILNAVEVTRNFGVKQRGEIDLHF